MSVYQFILKMLMQPQSKNTFLHKIELCLTPPCEGVDSPALINDTNSLMQLIPLVLKQILTESC